MGSSHSSDLGNKEACYMWCNRHSMSVFNLYIVNLCLYFSYQIVEREKEKGNNVFLSIYIALQDHVISLFLLPKIDVHYRKKRRTRKSRMISMSKINHIKTFACFAYTWILINVRLKETSTRLSSSFNWINILLRQY